MRRFPLTVGLALACATGPGPIEVGEPCMRCHMLVADARFAARLVAASGVARTFDSIDCLASEVFEHPDPDATVWVVPFDAPETIVRADRAVFVQRTDVRAPMGLTIVAYRTGSDAIPASGGMAWRDVLDLLHSQRPGRYTDAD